MSKRFTDMLLALLGWLWACDELKLHSLYQWVAVMAAVLLTVSFCIGRVIDHLEKDKAHNANTRPT